MYDATSCTRGRAHAAAPEAATAPPNRRGAATGRQADSCSTVNTTAGARF